MMCVSKISCKIWKCDTNAYNLNILTTKQILFTKVIYQKDVKMMYVLLCEPVLDVYYWGEQTKWLICRLWQDSKLV